MGKDKKNKDIPVSVFVEAKKRYLEQLQQILTPRLYEGFESLYEDALELLENEFEEKRQQTKSILKTFQDALKEIPVWNQDIIEHEAERIVQVSNCDYLDDLIDALFRAESKILTSVQTMSKTKAIKVKVPIASHFIHRCYVCAAREIFKNPFVFNHFKELTPRDKQNNLREAIFMINEGITNAVRELLPIRDILKNSLQTGDYSGTESDYSSENSDISSASESESDSDDERRKHKRKHHKHKHSKSDSESSVSESSVSEESESEDDKEESEELTLNENKIESSKNEEEEIDQYANNIQESPKNEREEVNMERFKSEDNNEDEDDEDNEETESFEDDDSESSEEETTNFEDREEMNGKSEEMVNGENSGMMGGFFNNLFGRKENEEEDLDNKEEENKASIQLDDIDNLLQNNPTEITQDNSDMVSVPSIAKPSDEIKQIVLEGNKIPKEYRIREEQEELERIEMEKKKEEERKMMELELMKMSKEEDNESIASSGILYRNDKKIKQGGEFMDLSELKSKENKKIKKEVTKFVKPIPTSQTKSREESLNKLIQKQREFYKKHISPQDNMSIISGMSKASSLNSKASLISAESRTKIVDNFLNKNSETKKSISYLSSIPQNKKEFEEEDSGDEYLSDPELNS